MHDRRWITKPPFGWPIDPTYPLSQGLLFFYACNEGAGNKLYDSVAGLNLSTIGFGSNNPWSVGSDGTAFSCSSTGEGAIATLPSYWQLGWPLTVAASITVQGTPTVGAGVIGLPVNNTGASPFVALEIFFTASGFQTGFASGSTYNIVNFGAYTIGSPTVVSATVTPTSQQMYQAGQLANSSSTAPSTASYLSTAMAAIGNYTGVNRNPNTLFSCAAVWSRSLSAIEHEAFALNPWACFVPPNSWELFQAVTGQSLFRPATLSLGTGGPFFQTAVNG